MATDIFANFAQVTLTSAINTTPGALTSETWAVSATSALPAITGGVTQFRCQVNNPSGTIVSPEIVIVTSINSGTSITVQRGAESSIITPHNIGDVLTLVQTATQMTNTQTNIVALQNSINSIQGTVNSLNIKANTRVYRSGAWTTNNNNNLLLFDSISFDRTNVNYGGSYGYSTGTGRFTVPVAGIYRVTAHAAAVPTVAGQQLQMEIYLNGVGASNGIGGGSGINWASAIITDILNCNVNDYIEIHTYCSTPGLTGATGFATSYASFSWVAQV